MTALVLPLFRTKEEFDRFKKKKGGPICPFRTLMRGKVSVNLLWAVTWKCLR